MDAFSATVFHRETQIKFRCARPVQPGFKNSSALFFLKGKSGWQIARFLSGFLRYESVAETDSPSLFPPVFLS